MKKKILLFAFVTLVLLSLQPADAQQPKKIPRIGFLSARPGVDPLEEAFRQGLRDLGYIEGQNIVIEWRFAKGKADLFRDFAAELVRLKVDVIVTGTPPGVRAVKQATNTIPIVMVTGDAVGSGLVSSLARPGGNITGLSFLGPEVRGKQLELLKEAFPKISRVVVFTDPAISSASSPDSVTDIEIGRQLGLQLQMLEVQGPDEFESSFKTAAERRAGAILIRAHPLFGVNRKRFADLAAKSGLPAIYPWEEFVEVGGLMAYGPSITDVYRRAATYVDKILKGAKPADLPVEQPTKFELVINLKAAKQIGVTIPQAVLYRADRVIK